MPKKIKKLKPLKNCNHEHQQYCFKKGFIITLEPSGSNYKVKYQIGHKAQYYKKGEEFDMQDGFQSIWDLYTKIYNYDHNK